MTIECIPISNREQWMKARHQDVTASVVGALFGEHPYCTKLELYLEKSESEPPPPFDDAVLRRGRIMEAAVASAAEEAKGWLLRKADAYYRDPEIRLGATPDYIVSEEGLPPLQCKSVDPRVFERDWTETEPPLWITLQALTEARMLNAPHAYVGALVLNRNYPLHIYKIPRSDAAEERLVEGVKQFWQDVLFGAMPPPDYARDGDAIARLYRKDDGSTIDLSGDNLLPALLEERSGLKAQVKVREARLAAIDAEIKDKLGNAAEAILGNWRITNKTTVRPEKLMPPSTYRTLRITDLRTKQKDEAA